MDYLDVVLNGYFKENNQEHLEKYFFREFKKAEKEQFFDADEFFSGCQKVIQYWEKYLQNKVFKRQEELYKMLDGAKNKTMSYGNLEGKTIEQKRQETIDFCEKELKDVRPDGIGSISFNVHLMSLTSGRVAYNMPYNEVLYIKDAIEKAFLKVKNKSEQLQSKPKTDYWQQDIDNEVTVNEFEKTVIKIFENTELDNDLGCFPMRFRMLPRTILDDNSIVNKRKKYLLKRMYLVLKYKEEHPVILELLKEYLLIVEPYPDIYSFVNTGVKKPQPVQETPTKKESDAKHTEAIKKLKSIWLADPKLTVEDFLQKGNDKAFWNDDLQLTLQRSISTYGTGKTFLANIFVAFKNWAIPEHLDYKEAGKVFCEVFNIDVKESTKEKYKLFISGNPKQIREVKRTFNV